MDTTFLEMIERILGHEGGYVNNPADPGGETNWGIAKRSYPHLDILNLTREKAIEIYYTDFWLRIGGNSLHPAVCYQVLDASVNHGVGNGIRMLQRAAGVIDDGNFGPVSVSAAKRIDTSDMIMRFNAERLEFYAKMKAFDYFGRGWTRRVAGNLRFGSGDN